MKKDTRKDSEEGQGQRGGRTGMRVSSAFPGRSGKMVKADTASTRRVHQQQINMSKDAIMNRRQMEMRRGVTPLHHGPGASTEPV